MVQAFSPIAVVIAVLSLAGSAIGVWASIRIARRAGVLDIPNERSSHSTPTPRVGGVPLVVSAVLCFAAWMLLSGRGILTDKEIAGTILLASGISILGLLDDLFDLSPMVRIVVQFALCVCCLWFIWPFFPVVSFIGAPWVRLLLIGAASVWCTWMLNLYNFMDGIDGLAGGEAAIVSMFFFFLFAWAGNAGWAVANLLISASALGFLMHNWPPAKVFMGDSGSAFLGAFYGMQSLVAPAATGIPFVVLVLPFSNFILDTTFTLIRRMLRGEKWYQAHRSHVYQRMTNLGMSHKEVTVFELIAVAASCLAAAACMRVAIHVRIFILAIVFIGLAIAGSHFLRKEEGQCTKSSCSS